MLELPDAWVWDSWLVDDGDRFHAFYLKAPRALRDPSRRHFNAVIGHSVSADLVAWTQLADAVAPADEPGFDDLATWTGSVVADPRGGWRMCYTGVARTEQGRVQRIGGARSDDLVTWRRDGPVVEADPRWYETDSVHDPEQAWRDPWVLPDPAGRGWHMLVTACVSEAARTDRGVVGHATSTDLSTWNVRPPLSTAGSGFGHLEVMQVVVIDGAHQLIFSCLATDLAPWRLALRQPGGMWSCPAASPLGPFDLAAAVPLTGPQLYAGHVVEDRHGRQVIIGFVGDGPDGFVGALADPVPLDELRASSASRAGPGMM